MNSILRDAAIDALIAKDGRRCFYCARRVSKNGTRKKGNVLTIDHVIPRALGGSDELSNLVLACEPCNKKKADSLQGLVELLREQKKQISQLRAERLHMEQTIARSRVEARSLRSRIAELQDALFLKLEPPSKPEVAELP